MGFFLLGSAISFSIGTLFHFRGAALIYLSAFAALPVVLSLEAGSGLPLVSLQRLLVVPLVFGLSLQLWLSRSSLRAVPLAGPLALLMFAYVISNLMSTAPTMGAWYRLVAVVLEEVGVYVLAYAVLTTPARLRLLQLGVVLALSGVLIFMGYEFISGHNPIAEAAVTHRDGLLFDYSLGERFGLRRLQSYFRNPLDLGVYLLLAAPVAMLLAHTARGLAKILARAVVLACLVAAVLTGSRMVVYTFAIFGLTLMILTKSWRAGLAAIGIATVGVVLVNRYVAFPVWDYVVDSALNPELYVTQVGGSSLDSLLRVTGEHLRLGIQRPLGGWGVGAFPPNPEGEKFDGYYVGYGEQGISYFFAETGVLGLLALVWVFGGIGLGVRRGLDAPPKSEMRLISVLFGATTIAYLASAQLEGFWHFGFYLVLAAATFRHQEVLAAGDRMNGVANERGAVSTQMDPGGE